MFALSAQRNPREHWRRLSGSIAVLGIVVLCGVAMLRAAGAEGAGPAHALPPPAMDEPAGAAHQEVAVLSGGCFWGIQGVFQHVRGVRQVVAGYAGGTREDASYETVSTGTTGHAESVQITFDPTQVSYGQLLRIFFSVALDPTELNRQGPDSGPQYRSEVFTTSDAQRQVATRYIAQLDAAHAFPAPIVTRVDPLPAFYAAEGYHQDYLLHHPNSMYIVINDMPKVANLQRVFPALYQSSPVLTAPLAPAS
jgi:peptide-methionine (S)-S-oxide reductase